MAPDEAQKVSWRERWQALRDVWAAIVLIVAVLGTIYLGIATPTEASGLGAAGALLVALGYRELDRAKLREIVRSTIVTSSMILLIVAAALLFGHVLMRLQAPQMLIALGRRAGPAGLGDPAADPGVPADRRDVPGHRLDHPDHDPDRAAGDHVAGPGSDLVRRGRDHHVRNGGDHAAHRPEPVRHQGRGARVRCATSPWAPCRSSWWRPWPC